MPDLTCAVEVRRRGVTRLCGAPAEQVGQDGTPICWRHALSAASDTMTLFTPPTPPTPKPKEDVVTTIKHLTALINASSLGTRTARVARRSVTAAEGDALARRAAEADRNNSGEFRDRADERTYRPVSGSTPGRTNRKDKTMAKGHHRLPQGNVT